MDRVVDNVVYTWQETDVISSWKITFTKCMIRVMPFQEKTFWLYFFVIMIQFFYCFSFKKETVFLRQLRKWLLFFESKKMFSSLKYVKVSCGSSKHLPLLNYSVLCIFWSLMIIESFQNPSKHFRVTGEVSDAEYNSLA